jgi:hypothetical protein
MNWEFWTWPRQIRELKMKLAQANKKLGQQAEALGQHHRKLDPIYERAKRGQHRSGL